MTEKLLLTLREKVHPLHVAVLVVDVQNDFCADGGFIHELGRDLSRVQSMVPNLVKFIDEARGANVPIIFIRSIWDERYLSPPLRERIQNKGWKRLPTTRDSWGADFYLVKPRPEDFVVTKYRYTGFYDTELDIVLHSLGTKTLIMTGTATNGCVDSTMRDGFFRGYYIVLVDDCCGAASDLLQQATIQTVDFAFGVVVTSRDVVEIWRDAQR